MIAVISPSVLSGSIAASASKSAMQRACALALLNNGSTIIRNPGKSNDDLVAIEIIQKLGAIIEYQDDLLIISSHGTVQGHDAIDCGESGLSLRMFAAIAALSNQEIILNGSGSLLKRPMHFFDEVFPLLNIHTKTTDGFLPVTIKGPLQPSAISIDGSMSSQYLTGLLFAFAAATKKEVIITVKNLKSKPYIDLSLQMLAYFGYDVVHEGYEIFRINPVVKIEKDITYNTEGDWSGAAFLLVAGAIAGNNIKIKGLDIFSTQADRAILDVLIVCGANLVIENDFILINNEQKLKAFEFDATDCPDLFPPLVALAAYCEGTSVIHGVSRLAGKESDRAVTLQDVFMKMGIEVSLKADDMIVHGGTGIKEATVSSHHDHRIAMACAVAALGASGNISIQEAEAVNKSYPAFYEHLQLLRATVSLTT